MVIDIDDVFARTYFPDENPVGKRVHLAGFNVQAEIVGVVGHVKQWGWTPMRNRRSKRSSIIRSCSFRRS